MTNEDEEQAGALDALTILDLSAGIAGPYAAKLFADYGARVIKVERPPSAAAPLNSSDSDPPSPKSERGLGGEVSDSPSPQAERGQGGEVSRAGLYLNTNKESLTLDYETEAGAAILHRLIEDADGLIEDYPSRRQADLGLDSASLLAHVPRLVICRVSAYASKGPWSGASYEALGGDSAAFSTGLHAFAAMLATLWHASQSEHGQVVEVDALSSLASELGPSLTQALNGAAVTAPARPESPQASELFNSSFGLADVDDGQGGVVQLPLGPFDLEVTPWLAGGPPLPGERTDQVLGEIGIEASEIEALRKEGIV